MNSLHLNHKISLESLDINSPFLFDEVFASLSPFALRHPTWILSNPYNFEEVKLKPYLLSFLKNDTMDIRKLKMRNWDNLPLFYELFTKQRMLNYLRVGNEWYAGGKMDLPKMKQSKFYPLFSVSHVAIFFIRPGSNGKRQLLFPCSVLLNMCVHQELPARSGTVASFIPTDLFWVVAASQPPWV